MVASSALFKTRMEEKKLYQTTINLTSAGKSRTGRTTQIYSTRIKRNV